MTDKSRLIELARGLIGLELCFLALPILSGRVKLTKHECIRATDLLRDAATALLEAAAAQPATETETETKEGDGE